MLGELLRWSADALVVPCVAIMTIDVYGVIRMPDVYTQLHAASKSVFVGDVSLPRLDRHRRCGHRRPGLP